MSKLELLPYLSYGFAVQNIYQYSFDDGEKDIHFSGTRPKLVAWLKNGVVRVSNREGFRDIKADGSFGLDTLEELWRGFSEEHKYLGTSAGNSPFAGGGVGFFSYDLGKKFEGIKTLSDDDLGLPDWCFAFYDGSNSCDWSPPVLPVKKGIAQPVLNAVKDLPSAPRNDEIVIPRERSDRRNLNARLLRSARNDGRDSRGDPHALRAGDDVHFRGNDGRDSRFRGNDMGVRNDEMARNDKEIPVFTGMTKAEYIRRVKRIKEYLRDGDVYQVNFAQRFSVKTNEEPLKLYQRLQKDSPVPYAAYLDFGSVQIISQSPELFLKKKLFNDTLVTEPIKGTRKRGLTREEDERLFHELVNSQKDRAELTMIIDLERNDLSRICRAGTVRVEDLYKIKSFPSVHHQVTTVKGELNQHARLVDIFKAMFPGGSVTGAPKIRAMEIIEELEPNCRGIYTGCIGYLDVRGSFQFNIAIRTIIISAGSAWFHLGGGIVADSDPEEEYLETIYKGGPFWQLFLNAEVTDGKHPFQAAN